MDVSKAIESRRSVRKYLSTPVSKEDLDTILNAALMAPSGNNAQPWKFLIIDSEEDKALLKEKNIFKQDFVLTAPTLILCLSDPDCFPAEKFEAALDDNNTLRAVRDLSLASQNMVLQATELGLGTCYIGWMDKPGIKKLFNIPKRFVAPYVITLGYPADEAHAARKKTIEEILIK